MPFVEFPVTTETDVITRRLEYFERSPRGNRVSDDPVILIHGAGSSALIWDTVQELLADAGYRSLAISLPGAGGSDRTENLDDYTPANYARDIKGSLDALGISRFALAGHSLGVSNVLNLAADHNEGLSIRALILMAGGNVVGRAPDTDERRARLTAENQLLDPETEAQRRAAWEPLHLGLSKTIRDQLWQDIQNNPPERNLGQRLGARKDMTPFAESCDLPTLFISGDADSVVPLDYTLAMYQKFKRTSRHCHVLHGVDHYPNAEVPVVLTEILVRFLSSHQLE